MISEHQKTKLLFCVGHAVEGIRNKTITDWDFKEFGVDKEHPPEGYDCLAINPKCGKCEVRLSDDDMAEWLKNPAVPPSCEDCFEVPCETCDKKCGEEEGKSLLYGSLSVWLCLECYAKEAPDVADSAGGRE